MIFDEQLTEEDLAVYLADVHVSRQEQVGRVRASEEGLRPAQRVREALRLARAARRLSKSRTTEDIKAYEWTTQFLAHHPDPKNLDKFALFQELARKRDLANRYQNDLGFKQDVTRWLDEGKLAKSLDVRKLDLVLDSAQATKVLDEDRFEEASQLPIKAKPELGSDLYVAVKKATEKLQKAPADEIQARKRQAGSC